MDFKIYFLFMIIVLAQSVPLSKRDKNEKFEEDLSTTKEKIIQSIETEDKDNLDRTKKSTKFCIQVCDDSSNCNCASKNSIINNDNKTITINVDDVKVEKEKDGLEEISEKTDETSEATTNKSEEREDTDEDSSSEEVSLEDNSNKSTETSTNNEKTCVVHGPYWVQGECTHNSSPTKCPHCNSSSGNLENDSLSVETKNSKLIPCNCSSHLFIDLNQLPKERELNKKNYIKLVNDECKHNTYDSTAATITTTTKKPKITKKIKPTKGKTMQTETKTTTTTTTTLKPKSYLLNSDKNLRLKKARLNKMVDQCKSLSEKVDKLSHGGNLDSSSVTSKPVGKLPNEINQNTETDQHSCGEDDHLHYHHHHHKNRLLAKKFSIRSADDSGLISSVENENYYNDEMNIDNPASK